MSSFVNTADRIIFKSFNLSKESLGIYRIFYCLYLLIMGVPTFLWINNFPSIFFNPPFISLASLFSEFPPYWFLMFLSLSACLLVILLLFGYKTRSVSLLLAFTILIGKSFSYSFGKINHDFLIWLIPLAMAFSNWGEAYSFDSKKINLHKNNEERNWPITLLALALCLAMFSAGLPKIWGGWLNLSSHAVKAHLLNSYYENGRQSLLAPFFLKLDSPFIWEFFDYAAITLEVTFLFAFIRPNLFRAYVFFAIIFHVLNFLMLNIAFNPNCILYLLFIDWNMVLDFFRKHKVLDYFNRLISVRNLIIVGIVYFIFVFIVLTKDNKDSSSIISPLNSILKFFNLSSLSIQLIMGSTVIFSTLILGIINVIYFIRNKKFSRPLLSSN